MPEVRLKLPTMHPDQLRAFETPGRYKAIRCGRRWGKTAYGACEAADTMLAGKLVGWFAPNYRMVSEAFSDLSNMLGPVVTHRDKTAGFMRTVNGGRIDFWSMENEQAGRSRKYHLVVMDEAAFGKASMMDTWQKSIEPTLLDYTGRALALSNTSGDDPENFFWQLCKNPEHRFHEYHAPSWANPHIPEQRPGESRIEHAIRRREIFADLRAKTEPLVFEQEYGAEFVNWAGQAFFAEDKMLDNGVPVPLPAHCGAVYATVDTATKTGKANDATAVVYWALTPVGQGPHPLIILDWDIMQIEGSLLEAWLPTVFQKLEGFAGTCRARAGSVGAHIEDKSSGMVLLQQAVRRNWPALPIDTKLTSLGKSERAISVSGYVYQGLVKFSEPAFLKTASYKGTTRNQLLSQVTRFRVGEKDKPGTVSDDDLLDCFTYGVSIGLGNIQGW